MPSITIREVDTSTAGVLSPTTNVAYVPGYAIMGPVNEPVLCDTLADFQKVFGPVPYRYVQGAQGSGQYSSLIPDVSKGEYETSYVYASDLLRLGLPVLFERVSPAVKMSTDTPPVLLLDWYATGTLGWTKSTPDAEDPSNPTETTITTTIKSAEPGSIAANIHFAISQSTLSGKVYYILSVNRAANVAVGTSATDPVNTLFTFDKELSNSNPRIKFYDTLTVDNSGLITFSFPDDILNFMDTSDGSTITVTSDYASGNLGFSSDEFYSENEFTPELLYNSFVSMVSGIEDKGEYIFKFITSGGYPVVSYSSNSLATKMVTVASGRGDCTALIDYAPSLSVLSSVPGENAYEVVNTWASALGSNNGEQMGNYGASFAPWCVFSSPTLDTQVTLSPSFAYLSAYANSTQSNANYYAVAGVVRGFVPNLVRPVERISNSLSNEMQPRSAGTSMNPIVEIRPYGNVIWGNRTLKNNTFDGELTATSFLNIRQLSNDVKRVVWVACKACTFEQNSSILWVDFKSKITPTLDQMVTNNGISNYKITRLPTDKKATIVAKITLYCIEAVEDFDITVELTDSQITIV